MAATRRLVPIMLAVIVGGCEESATTARDGGVNVDGAAVDATMGPPCNPQPETCDPQCTSARGDTYTLTDKDGITTRYPFCVWDETTCIKNPEGPSEEEPDCVQRCTCEAGCLWDGVACFRDNGCPALPLPGTVGDPYPSEGCTRCPSASWEPSDVIPLRWREPAAQYARHYRALHVVEGWWGECRDRASKTYNIYFGETQDPPLLRERVPVWSSEQPIGVEVKDDLYVQYPGDEGIYVKAEYALEGPFEHNTTYYWSIEITNLDGASVKGPVWSFTTVGPAQDTRCPASPTLQDQDGNVYETVQVGQQCWMQGNLAVGSYTTGSQSDNGQVEKDCLDSGDPACLGFYSWNEATNYGGAVSICPGGWHIPSVNEWSTLINHPDFARFDPQYQGYKETYGPSKGALCGYYWTIDEKTSGPDGIAEVVIFCHPSKGTAPDLDSFNKGSNKLSVRCLKN